MSYSFELDESTSDGVRRIALEQIDKAIAEIEDSELDVHETIHQVRKRCKKLRGLVRLVRPCMKDVYQQENAWYRDSARELSSFRDAQAFLESFEDLIESYGETIDSDSFMPLHKGLLARRESVVEDNAAIEDRLDVFLGRMHEGRSRVGDWPLNEEGFDLLEAGLVKTFGRGRKAMPCAYESPSAEAFHEWRKRVKYHWYHARLLKNSWKKPLSNYCKELKKLSDYLGDDHDLSVLQQAVFLEPDEFGSKEMLQAFFALVERRQKEFRLRAHPLGSRIYLEKPKKLGKLFRGYWKAWQREGALEPKLASLGELKSFPTPKR